MQLSSGDAEGLGWRKQTRREIFLAGMEQVVPWRQLLALNEPRYPTSGRRGRQPYALANMLRIHLSQQWYALSDPGMEEPLRDISSIRRFVLLSGLHRVQWISDPVELFDQVSLFFRDPLSSASIRVARQRVDASYALTISDPAGLASLLRERAIFQSLDYGRLSTAG